MRFTTDTHITAVPFADRLEVRLGRFAPLVLLIERAAFYNFADAINNREHDMTTPLQPKNREG